MVKELRLAGVSSMHDGKFMEDFNRRFARVPRNCHDAHRPVGDQDLDQMFSWHEERTMSRNLVENKRLGAVLATIQRGQGQRDVVRLAFPKMTLRQEQRSEA